MNRIINIISLRIKRLYNKWVGNNVRGISLLRRFYSFEIVGVNNTIDVRSRLPKDVRIFSMVTITDLLSKKELLLNKGKYGSKTTIVKFVLVLALPLRRQNYQLQRMAPRL